MMVNIQREGAERGISGRIEVNGGDKQRRCIPFGRGMGVLLDGRQRIGAPL